MITPGDDAGLHMHAFEDETMHFLEGQLEVTIGDDVFDLRAGENYFAPRSVLHRLCNVMDRPARGIVVTTPGLFDAFIARAGMTMGEKYSLPQHIPPTAI